VLPLELLLELLLVPRHPRAMREMQVPLLVQPLVLLLAMMQQ
jgi:hypothetical protein